MITDLNFLEYGQPWLPKDSEIRSRMEKYKRNHMIFNKKHCDLEDYQESFKRIERVIGNFQDYISYANVINYQKLMTVKLADLIMSELPEIVSTDKETLSLITENTDLFSKLYQSFIDISRYGDSIAYIAYDEESKCGNFEIVSPMMWIPIVSNYNVKKIVQHVLAWEITEGKNKSLLVQIHNKGNFEQRVYKLEGNAFGEQIIGYMLREVEVIQTGLSDFAVVDLHNLTTSDRLTGYDDYSDVDDIIKEIMIRMSQIDRILDKHSSPSMAVPSSALHQDIHTGELVLKTGNGYVRDSNDDPLPQYITWDGELSSAFTQLENLLNQLYVMSEMGSLLSVNSTDNGGVVSGRALRYKLLSPLLKAKRTTVFANSPIKKILYLLSELGGNGISKITDKITINWRDGLPDDETEEAEIIKSRRESGTISIKKALIKYDGMSEQEADIEIQTMKDEDSSDNPFDGTLIDDNVE